MMQIKFNNDETFYPISGHQFINLKRVRLYFDDVASIPKDNPSGFNVYDENELPLYLYENYSVVYEVNELAGYIDFTCDTEIYSVYYTYDEHTLYLNGIQIVSGGVQVHDGVLIKSGQGKEFAEATADIYFTDKNGIPNYKVELSEDQIKDEVTEEITTNIIKTIVEVSDEEKAQLLETKNNEELLQAISHSVNMMRDICEHQITSGIDYNEKHYSYTLEDQNNLLTAVNLSKSTGLDVPYHADGETCTLYTADEIGMVYVINQTNLTHHQTYFNQLKLYIQSLSDIEAVNSVVYGQELVDGYLATYQAIMAQSKAIIAAYLNVDEAAVDSILNESSMMSLAL